MLDSVPYYLLSLLTIGALVHFFITRPAYYWFFVIIFLPTIGPIVYFFVNIAMPLLGVGGDMVEGKVALTMAQRKRVRELEHKIQDNPLPYDYAQLGELLFRRGDYAKAEPMLRQAVRKIDDEPEPQYWLALTLEKLGKPDETVKLLRPIINKEPRYKFGEAFLAYARALDKAGKKTEALDAYAKVLNQSTFTEARVRYGLLLAETGDVVAARDQLERAVRESRDLPRYNLRTARPFVRQAKAWLSANRG